MIVEAVVDSEGCVASVKILKALPYRMVDQALATLLWHGYEPARIDGKAVAMKYVLTFGYGVS
jgi:outer membrane biosynthesis protein TonB